MNEKMFLRWEPFPKGAGLDTTSIVWYTDDEGKEERFYLRVEDTNHFLEADYDSLVYFQMRIACFKSRYQRTLDQLIRIVQTICPDGGWNIHTSEIIQEHCSKLEDCQRNIECYEMILNELRRRNEYK